MKNYDKKIELLSRETQIALEQVDIDKLIIDNTAKKKVDDSVQILFDKMRRSIEDEVRSIFAPRFTFENVSESGIMICGKEENIASGKSTFYEIFNAFYQTISPDAFEKATYMSGRKSALHFSDDFRKILLINNIMNLPFSEEKFMSLYSKFDCRSAWWDKPIEYELGGTANSPYVAAVIKKPFTTYPWIEKGFQKNNKFLEGYLQTLFNCASDILRVIGEGKGNRLDNRKIALSVAASDEPDQEVEFVQIYYTNIYCQEWIEIDKIIYCIVARLLSTNDKDDIVELLASLDDLKDALLEKLNHNILENVEYDRIVNEVKSALRDVKAAKFRINSLLNEIRIVYEDYRINYLSNK